MSKKTNSKKATQKAGAAKKANSVAGSKNKKTALIISAAALFLVACILIGIFVVKPAIDKGNETTKPTGIEGMSETKIGDYTYVDYKGASIPKEFADVLVQAEADSAAACEEYGVALTLGDRKISRSEFHLYYQDQYRIQMNEVLYSQQQTGSNRTGYDPYVLPDEQMHPTKKSITWAEEFTLKVGEWLAKDYAGFDLAIKNNIQLPEMQIYSIIQNYLRIESYAKSADKTVDRFIQDNYTPGITYAMFCARDIMSAYADKYEIVKKQELLESYTDEKVTAKFEESPNQYSVIIGRVYPIEGEYDAVEVSKISNEQQFLDYAVANFPQEGYNAEVRTQCNYVDYTTLLDVFDEKVADWMFNSDRVEGEISVVEGQLFKYLVYIERLPFFTTSKSVLAFQIDIDQTQSEEAQKAQIDDVKKTFEDWKSNDGSYDGFYMIAQRSEYEFEKSVMNGEYTYYEVNNWVMDESRKQGDAEFFTDGTGAYMLYYVKNNENEFDWNYYIRNEFCDTDYETHYENETEGKYEIELNSKVVTQVFKSANVRITEYINESKKESQKQS